MKKVLIFILTLALTLGLASCLGDNPPEECTAHVDENNDGKCDVCDYTMSTTTPGGGNAGTGNTNTDTGSGTTDTGSGTTDTGSTPPASTDTTTTPDVDEKPEDKGGLGAGAIVAITLGGTAVTGCGVFALVWFVIKKKRWAEFVAIFKK